MLGRIWSWKVEYLFVDLGRSDVFFTPTGIFCERRDPHRASRRKLLLVSSEISFQKPRPSRRDLFVANKFHFSGTLADNRLPSAALAASECHGELSNIPAAFIPAGTDHHARPAYWLVRTPKTAELLID